MVRFENGLGQVSEEMTAKQIEQPKVLAKKPSH
jgi:hypothetical protein